MSRMPEREEPHSRGVKLTYDDYVLFPDDGMRHELIDGEHFVTPAPNTRHQRISRRLTVALVEWLEDHPVGEVFYAPFDVVFSKFDVVEPDLVYLSHERARELLTDQHALGADLVIEIASPGTRRRDETLKLKLYERAGVREYWFVDPDRDVLRVYRRTPYQFATPECFSGTDTVVTSPLFPGFELRLGKLFG
jgi:Uma2 family endonuclease